MGRVKQFLELYQEMVTLQKDWEQLIAQKIRTKTKNPIKWLKIWLHNLKIDIKSDGMVYDLIDLQYALIKLSVNMTDAEQEYVLMAIFADEWLDALKRNAYKQLQRAYEQLRFGAYEKVNSLW